MPSLQSPAKSIQPCQFDSARPARFVDALVTNHCARPARSLRLPPDCPTRLGTLVMLRNLLLIAGFVASTTLSAGGCRSCSDCHDYDPPVANCECAGYGQRTGSVSCGGCDSGGYTSGTTGGCACGGHHGGVYQGEIPATQQYIDATHVEIGT